MNCTFVNLSFSYKDKFLLEARIKALSCTKLDFVTTKKKIYLAENMFATINWEKLKKENLLTQFCIKGRTSDIATMMVGETISDTSL